jgi:cytochrome c oxidase cbb3-type subunit 2
MLKEQPDRFGAVVVTGLALWTAVGLVTLGVLHLALPRRLSFPTLTTTISGYTTCNSPLYARDDASDPVRGVLAGPSACDGGGNDARSLLHAYLAGAELTVVRSAERPTVDNALRARGATLFASHCAGCHGPNGAGNGPDACALAIQPAKLETGIYALRTTEHDALPTDDDIFTTISRGIHGTAMPPWFALPERDRWALVEHVKTLAKAFTEDTAPDPVATTAAPAATADRLAHGRKLYLERGCASCHGERGLGDGPASQFLPVPPRNFIAGRLHRGTALADIHTTLVTGLDGTPMAAFDKVMTPEELWDVSLYIESLVPRDVERGALRCLERPSIDFQEQFGVRAVLRALPALTTP